MREVQECVGCGSKRLRSYKANLSPFLAEMVHLVPRSRVRFVRCRSCGLLFYDPRMTDEEIALLYEDYRGKRYQSVRQKHEPWYTPEMNECVGNDADTLRERKETLFSVLAENTDVNAIHRILDYGGDQGQFISDQLADRERFVYDISGVPTLPGIKSVDAAQGFPNDLDLIMCCHVLEHVSFPKEILERLRALGNEGTLYYFELPFDSPMKSRRTGLSKKLFGILTRSSTFVNVNNKMRGFSFSMHEHQNYFDEASLREFLERNGFGVQVIKRTTVPTLGIRAEIICCLAKKK
ncbi:MAG: hypothetical protein A4E32_00391 [Methanomassiliicoccales archaeon PtaU1.Bin124]|nr:MAG: hypothetical protein A4E32_00391 [Methanomassiliicoccales archaeon PtaU1.Bin124]